MRPPTPPTCMDEDYDSSSEDEYVWTAASRPRLPQRQGRGGDPELTCNFLEPPSHKPSLRSSRSRSAPPSSTPSRSQRPYRLRALPPLRGIMLAAPTVDLSFDNDDDWMPPTPSGRPLYRAASVGNSWGVTSIGRGFQWNNHNRDDDDSDQEKNVEVATGAVVGHSQDKPTLLRPTRPAWLSSAAVPRSAATNGVPVISTAVTPPSPLPPLSPRTGSYITGPLTRSPVSSRPSSPRPLSSQPTSPRPMSPMVPTPSSLSLRSPLSSTPSSPRSSTMPRMRRRSSQQRVSLVAGRVSIAPVEPPCSMPAGPQKLIRTNSAASYLSVASSVGPPTPNEQPRSLGERSISEFVVEREIGRGAYGLVKRAREMLDDGTMGVRAEVLIPPYRNVIDASSQPPLVIKQIIKSRILADCWKRHPKFGTIPIEIYVMSAISTTHYVLPSPRPWNPLRSKSNIENEWIEGKVVSGHPNICPLLDFFEDNHYYYLVLPSTTPESRPDEPQPPSDLFELVESYPHGLPPDLVRTYLGQIADAVAFLHSKGIGEQNPSLRNLRRLEAPPVVHRDIKDENVVLGADGKCVLIDFGSSGLVRKGGWDTFSGT